MNTETLAPQPKLNQHLQDLRRDAGNVAQDVKDHTQAKLQDIKEQATARFEDAREETTARLEQAKVTTREIVATARGFIAEHPFVALGAGVVLGILLSARMRR